MQLHCSIAFVLEPPQGFPYVGVMCVELLLIGQRVRFMVIQGYGRHHAH
jgi:hypothetical protein